LKTHSAEAPLIGLIGSEPHAFIDVLASKQITNECSTRIPTGTMLTVDEIRALSDMDPELEQVSFY
jgi:hypothetical protein